VTAPTSRRRADQGQPAHTSARTSRGELGAESARTLGRPQGDGYAERAAERPYPGSRWRAAWRGLLGQPVRWPATCDRSCPRRGSRRAWPTAARHDGENVRFEPAETSKDDDRTTRAGLSPRRRAQLTVGDGSARCHASTPACTTCPRAAGRAGDLVLEEGGAAAAHHRPGEPYVVCSAAPSHPTARRDRQPAGRPPES